MIPELCSSGQSVYNCLNPNLGQSPNWATSLTIWIETEFLCRWKKEVDGSVADVS